MKTFLLLAASGGFLTMAPVAFAQDGSSVNIDPPCFGSRTCSTQVPEPGTMGLFAAGIGALAIRKRRRKSDAE